MRVVTAIAGVWATLVLAFPALAEDESCPPLPIGVHETTNEGSTSYIVVSKATSLSFDEGSFELAEAEARLEAKRSLMSHLAPEFKQMRFSGLINVSVCRANDEVFATLQMDEANIRRAAKMQDLMRESFRIAPTPKP